MQDKPTITILLAAHNRHRLIGATLDSIKAQTYTNWECIIVDDYSTDSTFEVIEKNIEADKRFYLFRKTGNYKKGLPGSRNYALDIAAGKKPKFIQFFDDDDLMHPRKLELQLKELLQKPENQFSLCGRLNFEHTGEINYNESQVISTSSRLKAAESFLKGELRFGVQAALLNYEFIKDLRFDEELQYAEDWVFFSKLLFLSHPTFSLINKVLFYRRKHPFSMTGTGVKEVNKKGAETMAGLKIFDFLTAKNLHTKASLFYFMRRFLLYQFDSLKIEEVGNLIKSNDECSKFDYFRYKGAIRTHRIFRKSVLKILNFN